MTGAPTDARAEQPAYDAFISYSTAVDYRFVRQLKAFLESLHTLKTPGKPLRPLHVCVDGIDFSIVTLRRGMRGAGADLTRGAVEQLLVAHLARASYLLILCPGLDYETEWRDFELAWWLEHRGTDTIFLAVTRGREPARASERFFSRRVLTAGLHKRIWFDFRGHAGRAAQDMVSVRDFDEERTRLAAELYGETVQNIQPLWLREQRRRARAWASASTGASAGLLALASVAWVQCDKAVAAEQRAKEEAARAERARLIAVAERVDTTLDAPGGWLEGLPAAMAAFASTPGAVRPSVLEGALARAAFAAVPVVEIPTDAPYSAVAMSADGSRVAVADTTGVLGLWNGETGALIAREKVDDIFRWVEISSAGDAVVTAGRSGARIWGAAPLATRCTMPCDGEVFQVALSPDDRLALTTCTNRHHDVVEIASCHPVASLGREARRGSDGTIENPYFVNVEHIATFSPDGGAVAIPDPIAGFSLWRLPPAHGERRFGTAGPRVLGATFAGATDRVLVMEHGQHAAVWDVASGKRKVEIGATSAGVSFDGRRLVAYGDHTIQLVAVDDPSKRDSLAGPDLAQPAFSQDGQYVFGTSGDGVLRVWDPVSKHLVMALRGRTELMDSAILSRDGSKIATSGREGAVRVWNIESRASNHVDVIRTLAFSPNGERAVSGAWDGQVQLWDPATGARVAELLSHKSEVFDARFSRDGSRLLTASSGAVYLQDGFDGKMLRPLPLGDAMVAHVAFAADGSRVLTNGSLDGNLLDAVILWDANTGERLARLDADDVFDAAFLADGRVVLLQRKPGVPAAPGPASVWSADGMQRERDLADPAGEVEAIGVSANGEEIATVHRSGTRRVARIWRAEAPPVALAADLDPSLDGSLDAQVTFSHDGKHLATFSHAPVARIWDTRSGALAVTLRVGASMIDDVAFVAGDTKVVTHDLDRNVTVWDAATGEPTGKFEGVTLSRLSADGARLAAASGRRLRFLDLSPQALFAFGCRVIHGMRLFPGLASEEVESLRQGCGFADWRRIGPRAD
jgi:WD40 repeat protein